MTSAELTDVKEIAPLTRGSAGAALFSMTWPSMIGGIMLLGIFVVDAYFAGQLGTAELAAIGFAFPVVVGSVYLAIGMGTGAGAAVGRLVGEGRFDRCSQMATNALGLSQLAITLLWVAFLGFGPELFTLMGASEPLHELIGDYVYVVLGGLWIFSIGVVSGSIMRAHGNARTPALAMILCSTTNLVFDPILMFGWGPFPELGLAGVAWATVLGASSGVALSLFHMLKMRQLASIVVAIRSWREDSVRLLRVSAPAAGIQLLMPLSQVVVTRLVASSGPAAVAALGVGTRIEVLSMVVLIALSTSLSSFVAQNWGAGHSERVYQAILHCLHFALAWVVLLFCVTHLFSLEIAHVFSDDPAVVDVLVLYIVWALPTSGFVGLATLIYGALNALEMPIVATALSVSRVCVLFIPLAMFGFWLSQVAGVFLGIGAANATAGIVIYFATRHVIARERSRNALPVSR